MTTLTLTFEGLKLKQHDTKAFIGNNRIIATVFPRNDEHPYSKQEVSRLLTNFKEKYANKPITFQAAIEIPDLGFRSAKSFQSSSRVVLTDRYVWNHTGQFVIYAWRTPTPKGGVGEHNDCLWECLTQIRFPMKEITFQWRSASKMKSKLGLQRNDPIHYSLLPKIEEGIRININCVGDYEYTSPNNYVRTMTVKLHNGHYTLLNNKDKKLIARVPHKKQELLMYFSDGETSTCYDGVNIFVKPTENLKDEFPDYAIVKTLHEDVVQEHANYVAKVQAMFDATEGEIDMTKYCYSVYETAKVLTYQHFKTLNEPDPITPMEEIWLLNTFKGGLMYGEDVVLENAYEYDQKSAYPYHLIQPHIDFPMKEGTFQKIDVLPEILSYGIYRVEIDMVADPHINKLFRFNHLHYYTHFDIKMARDLGLPMMLIQDEESNCLLYKTGRLKGCTMFKNLMDYLFDLKMKKVPFAKEIINIIWGMLCERRKLYRITRPDGDKEVHINDATILGIIPTATGHRIAYLKNDCPVFVHNYARLGVFLTSRVRLTLMSVMLPYKDHIYRFHTDGFISDEEIPELTLGEEIGNFEIKNKGRCCISNCMRVVWEEN